MQIQVREFADSDTKRVKELIGIYNTFFEDIDPWKAIHYGKNAVEFYLQQMIQQTHINGKFLIVVVDGVIVGFVQGHVHKPSKSEIMERGNFLSGDVDNLFLLEEFRSYGIGTMLMQEMESFFLTQGCTSIALNVFAPNIKAQEFYRKLGFSPRATVMVKRLTTK